MMKEKLPLLISVPHGGDVIPPEIETACLLKQTDIVIDGDAWTRTLYDFNGLALEYHDTEIARVAVDLNRCQTDLPPANPDGIVKTVTVTGKKIWNSPTGLSEREREKLIHRYYLPYHHALERAANNPQIKLAIDCHSMLDYGPAKGKESWEYRPLFCISNRGTETGVEGQEKVTAPVELMVRMKELLEKKFYKLQEESDARALVTMNTPFKGGFITRHHGNIRKIPWIQLEINRQLYLPESLLMTQQPNDLAKKKIHEIRDQLYDVFSELLQDIQPSQDKDVI